MDQTCQLNELAASEIEQLEKDGIRLTASEIVELNALGWAIHQPETRRLLARGRPVEVGGAVLWPLTINGVDWIERNNVPTETVTPALAYAMAFGRSDGAGLDCDGREAEGRVTAWMRKLRCTKTELLEAVNQVVMQDVRPAMPPDPDGNPMTLGDFSAFLSATCGGDADFWERRCSFGYCLAVLSVFVMQNRVDNKPCSHDPRIVATRVMGVACERIRASRVVQGG
jgi:hypothetical protein